MFVHGRRGAHLGLQLQGWTEPPGHFRIFRDSVETDALTMSVRKKLKDSGGQPCDINTDEELFTFLKNAQKAQD